LRASAKHLMVDVLTTLGVIVGLAATHYFDWAWLDNVMALLVAVYILREGLAIVRRSAGALIDETDLNSLSQLAQALRKSRFEGLIDIHNLKIIRSGRFHHIDAHMVVPEFWSVEKAHEHSRLYESAVLADYPFAGELALQLDPCLRAYCRSCDVHDCPIRRNAFVRLRSYEPSALGGPVKSDDQFWGPVHG
jgi:cation diffusion facilitator family transporter